MGPLSGKKLRDKMLSCAEKSENRPLQKYERDFLNFLSIFLADERAKKIYMEMVVDSIFRDFFCSASVIFSDLESLKSEDIQEYLKKVTFLQEDDVIPVQRLLKASLTNKYSPRPGSEFKQRIKEKQHSCYLCGQSVHSTDETEVDHIWPYSLGGGTGADNLKVAHASCAAIKADSATPADSLLGGNVYSSHPDGLNNHPSALPFWPSEIRGKEEFNSYRRNLVSSGLRLAILMKQEFKCVSCNAAFSEKGVGEVSLLRDRDALTSSITSLRAYCEKCIQNNREISNG